MALSLVLFVQATNVYPQLLLGRLLFSLGGAAVSTMVTAVLPAVTKFGSISSSATGQEEGQLNNSGEAGSSSPSSRLAGFVGTCAGCGALISLAIFLPLPARLEEAGVSAPRAVQYSYYVVGGVALVVSAWCFLGLRNLSGEEGKGWHSLFAAPSSEVITSMPSEEIEEEANVVESAVKKMGPSSLPYRRQFVTAVALGFRNRDICLGNVGGFIARSSSVCISLFIPLSVNHFYRTSGLCRGNENGTTSGGGGLGDIKRSCPQAYILASILTGVSQLVALIVAHAFGFLSVKQHRFHLPLLFAALSGVAGYAWFAFLPDPRFEGGHAGVFIVMALIGMSQIGAIVCSLAVLSNGILTVKNKTVVQSSNNDNNDPHPSNDNEQQPLLHSSHDIDNNLEQSLELSHLKGSIAGVYSLYGGVGILLLTKLGGLLFDTVSPRVPFYLMAGFNGILFLTAILCGLNKARPK